MLILAFKHPFLQWGAEKIESVTSMSQDWRGNTMDYNRLAELLFPDVTETPEEVEARYPGKRSAGGRKGHS